MSSTTESPAAAVAKLLSKLQKNRSQASPKELRELALQAIRYLEARVEKVEEIEGKMGNTEIARLQVQVETLNSNETKNDSEYLALAVAERKLADLEQRQSRASENARAAHGILLEELITWPVGLISCMASANAQELFDKLAKLLDPYLEGRPAIEAIQNIPAYHAAVYQSTWFPPSRVDVMQGTASGTDHARAAINAIKKHLEGPTFAKAEKL